MVEISTSPHAASLPSTQALQHALDAMFAMAQVHRDDILRNFETSQEGWDGQTYMVVYPTKYCPVGCSHCYFASPKPQKETTGRAIGADELPYLLPTLDAANVDFLQITGGGEPLLEMDTVVAIVNASRANRIDIHTSAVTLVSSTKARADIDRIFEAFASNDGGDEFNFRVSVDEFHLANMTGRAVQNVIDIFRDNRDRYAKAGFRLKLHSLIGDASIPSIVEGLAPHLADVAYAIGNEYGKAFPEPHPAEMTFLDGTIVRMDYSLRMYADASPDMAEIDRVDRAIRAYDGLRIYTPGLHTNKDGRKGLCFIIHEDGNMELWNTALRDNTPNIRSHSYEEVKRAVFSDVIQVASLERSSHYTEHLLDEVHPMANRRAKSIGSATHYNWNAFLEPRDRLYVSLRILQDFYADGRISADNLARFSSVVRQAVMAGKSHLQELYFTDVTRAGECRP